MAGKKSGSKSGGILDLLAYIAVCFGGIALLVAFILGHLGISIGLVGILQKIANIIGWIVLCLLSTNFIKSKKKIWLWVVWAVALVMIIVGVILA